MENASKALLIAGAVLIVILLIGIGMLIYSKSTGVVDTAASTMNTQEIQMFNSQFSVYEGEQEIGSVKSLIQGIIANNATHKNDANKVVGITLTNKNGASNSTWSASKPTDISNNITKNLKSGSTYRVAFAYETNGYVKDVYLTEI